MAQNREQTQKKSRMRQKYTMNIPLALSIIGMIVCWVPIKGAQESAYILFLIAGLVYSFLIMEQVSNKPLSAPKKLLNMCIKLFPILAVMSQSAILVRIFSTYGSTIAEKETTGALPPIFKTYNIATAISVNLEMFLLYILTSKELRSSDDGPPSKRQKMIEKAAFWAFLLAGTCGLTFIALLYTVITRYLTDG